MAEPDDYYALFFGEDGLVHRPATGEMWEKVRHGGWHASDLGTARERKASGERMEERQRRQVDSGDQ